MKFQSVAAFEKHLAAHLPLVYLIVAPCSYERRQIVDKVMRALQQKSPHVSLATYDAAIASLQDLLLEMDSRQLFEGQKVICLEEAEKLKKQDLEVLEQYLKHPSPFSYLILSAAKGLKELSQVKEMALLDLSEEKPWDRQKRLRAWVVAETARRGKRMTAEAVQSFFEQIGFDLPTLSQELEKLFCYVAERPTIEQADVRAISTTSSLQTPWQLAEAFVWSSERVERGSVTDLSGFLSFLTLVRTQLHHGLTIASLQEKGCSTQEIAHHLPQLKLSLVEKYCGIARVKRAPFFMKALELHFDMELLSKNGSFSADVLFDLFHLKFTSLKHAASSA